MHAFCFVSLRYMTLMIQSVTLLRRFCSFGIAVQVVNCAMSSEPEVVVNVEAEALKEQGNVEFKNGNFAAAEKLYTAALELDPSNSKYLVNRSLCYASMLQWDKSYNDAKDALSVAPKFQKAHFRAVKALFELKRFKEARLAILAGLKECGESKEMKSLEDELLTRTGIPLRPKSTDFEIVGELGDGNFSKVYKAMHKSTERVYAVKTIEKMTVDRMKKRHGNINNEILMEKRALNRLDHPGIVQLYNTFQDYGTLYYQMEFVGGRDLWDRLHEPQLVGKLNSEGRCVHTPVEGALHVQVGAHWSLARFYLAEAISAVEHMHRRGIAHRDIKPENMIISEDGHLKFIDFGTAKDFIQTDLNGPEFVGTPEYLSPSTVQNKSCGIEVDLWALGVVLFQMLLGYTPFGAPSPYLTFLRIKRSFLQIPDWVPAPLASMIRLLLQVDPKARLRSTRGVDTDLPADAFAGPLPQLSYDGLRNHEMFRDPTCTSGAAKDLQGGGGDELSTVPGVRTVYERTAWKMPTLREICLRAVGRAALVLADAINENGGVRPTTPAWMQKFDLMKLPALDRAQIQHYLSRQQRLHTPGVFRLFCASLVDARCRRSDPSTGEYVGFTRLLQGHWDKDFYFLQLSAPQFGAAAAQNSGGDASSVEAEETQLRPLLAAVNKLRPRFLVMLGDFTASCPSDGALFDTHVEALRKCMARVSETIPVVFCPGSRDVGEVPTPASLAAYRSRFGADYFGFWYGGVRGIVINSSLLIHPEGAPDEAARQEVWLTEEIEQSKLCSNAMVLFTYHPWFLTDIDEPDSEVEVPAGSENLHGSKIRTCPRHIRQKWLHLLRHQKVKLTFSSSAGRVTLDGAAAPAAVLSTKAVRPYPRKKSAKRRVEDSAESATTDPDMKPSEVIAQALASGELAAADVAPLPAESHEEDQVLPPVPPTAREVSAAESAAAIEGAAAATEEEDSDRESDYAPEDEGLVDSAEVKKALDAAEAGDAGEKEEEDIFLNVDEECEGPELLFEPSVAAAAKEGAGAGGVSCAGLRAVFVQEYDMQHRYFLPEEIPKSQAELQQIFE